MTAEAVRIRRAERAALRAGALDCAARTLSNGGRPARMIHAIATISDAERARNRPGAGPKILYRSEDVRISDTRPERAATGIRRASNGWHAIKAGRLVDTFTGPGCKLAAIKAAGTNREIG